jgi:hypothetical protein
VACILQQAYLQATSNQQQTTNNWGDKMKQKIYLLVLLLFILPGIGLSFVMTSGKDFTSMLTEVVSLGSIVSGGGITVTQSVDSVNLPSYISGGDCEIIGVIDVDMLLSAGASVDLQNVKVYPNPYKPNSGTIYDNNPIVGEGIIFSGLTQKAKIQIFNIAGELVTEFEEEDGDGIYVWDTRNKNGDKVASGVYIYFITNPDDESQKTKGRIVIIR